jgi:hypothetical protein
MMVMLNGMKMEDANALMQLVRKEHEKPALSRK